MGRNCSHCGFENTKDARFCRNCGQRVTSVCPDCSAELTEDALFCPSCGRRMITECPECSSKVSEEVTFCPSCGTNIEFYEVAIDHLERGHEYMKTNEYELALEEYRSALQYIPNSQEAQESLEKAQDLSQSLDELVSRADRLFAQEDYEEAEQLYREAQSLGLKSKEIDHILTSIPARIDERNFEEFRNEWSRLVDSNQANKALALAQEKVNQFGRDRLSEYISRAESRDKEQQITRNMKAAEEAFNDGDYSFALTRLSSVIERQPEHTRALELRQQSERALSFRRKKRIRSAAIIVSILTVAVVALILVNNQRSIQQEINTYEEARRQSDPQIYLSKYPQGQHAREMRFLEDSLEVRAYNTISDAIDLQRLNDFIKKYPNGRYKAEIQSRIDSILAKRELNAFEKARNANTVASYGQYLAQFSNGNHSKEARRLMSIAEEKADYGFAIHSNTENALKGFLSKHPQSQHSDEIRNRLNDLPELRAYNTAVRQNTVDGYKLYLLLFPNGKWASDIKERMSNIHTPCSKCNSTGICQECNGRASWVESSYREGRWETCPVCKGTMRSSHSNWCYNCDKKGPGYSTTGKVWVAGRTTEHKITCQGCSGTGKCKKCGGKGFTVEHGL